MEVLNWRVSTQVDQQNHSVWWRWQIKDLKKKTCIYLNWKMPQKHKQVSLCNVEDGAAQTTLIWGLAIASSH